MEKQQQVFVQSSANSSQWQAGEKLSAPKTQSSQIKKQNHVIKGASGRVSSNMTQVKSTNQQDASEHGEENVGLAVPEQTMSLLQTPEQERTYRKLVVVPDGQSVTKRDRSVSPCVSESTSYTVPTHKQDVTEYKEFNSATLEKYYGNVTPYGTVAKNEQEQPSFDSVDVPNVSEDPGTVRVETPFIKSTSASRSHSRISSPLYTTLLRTNASGTSQVQLLSNNSVDYVDFVPKIVKESFWSREYREFGVCVEEANLWLAENAEYQVTQCESVRHRMDQFHELNTENTASDDRSYVIGLRLWVKRQPDKFRPTILNYQNIIPDYKTKNKDRKWKRGDCPYMEDLPKTLEKLNQEMLAMPLQGRFLNVETVPLNYAIAHRTDGTLNADTTYCNVDAQGLWEFFMIRIYSADSESHNTSPDLGYVDFVPGILSMPPSTPQFESHATLIIKASDWMKRERSKKIINIQSVEFPFKMRHLNASKGYLNTSISCFETTRVSALHTTLRVLRVWYSRENVQDDGRKSVELSLFGEDLKQEIDVATFVPCQLTTRWCCGAQRAIHATMRHTVARMNDWLSRTGAEVICVQTDNVEKWQKSSYNVHTMLPSRTYNKEDHVSTLCRSSLECRLTVIRVFFKPNALTNVVEPPTDKPAEPFCCFVGCAIM
ncbi:unnamed protein product [Clavelina lepadiformis]|uniref:Uncharacterized protein n=1 Tax=Clavelina lepadiformis TaxID=159417 RepID=A0ABP0GZN9_CLALP